MDEEEERRSWEIRPRDRELCNAGVKRPGCHQADIVTNPPNDPWDLICLAWSALTGVTGEKKKREAHTFHWNLCWAHLVLCQRSSGLSPITPARMLCTAKKIKANWGVYPGGELIDWCRERRINMQKSKGLVFFGGFSGCRETLFFLIMW